MVPRLGWTFSQSNHIGENTWTTDDTLKVTHHNMNQKEIMIALKLYGIMASSLLLSGLIVSRIGSYNWYCLKNNHFRF